MRSGPRAFGVGDVDEHAARERVGDCDEPLHRSVARFGRYLTAAEGDAYDAQLSQRYPDWATDPASGLFRLERAQGADALRCSVSSTGAS